MHTAVTPERARLMAFSASRQPDTLAPGAITSPPDLHANLSQASADDLPFEAGGKLSEQRRKDYWQAEGRGNLSFAEQNQQWNAATHRVILRLMAIPQEADARHMKTTELARETLRHLGLTGSAATTDFTFSSRKHGAQTVTLFSDIEAFRTTYFDGPSDIRGFVKKIAEQCLRPDRSVDIATLQERLEAVRPLLVSFGDQSVEALVEDYAISYGLLTQREPHVRDTIAEATAQQLQSDVSDGQKKGLFKALAHIQEEISREQATPGQPKVEAKPLAHAVPEPRTPTDQRREEAQARGGMPAAAPTAEGRPDASESRAVERIEERLRRELGKEISLSPKQKEIIQTMPITENEFIAVYKAQYARLKQQDKSPDEMMRALDHILNTIDTDEDGKTFFVIRIERESEDAIIADAYPRLP